MQIEFNVYDWDRLESDDFLGGTEVRLEPLARTQKPLRQWRVLENEDGEEDDLGELLVVVHWRYNPAADYAPFRESDDDHRRKPNELRVAAIQGRRLAVNGWFVVDEARERALLDAATADHAARVVDALSGAAPYVHAATLEQE